MKEEKDNKNAKISKSMTGNSNSEKWTEEEATNFMNKAVELSENEDYDFIGEIAKDLKRTKHIFDYLSRKFTQLNTQKVNNTTLK